MADAEPGVAGELRDGRSLLLTRRMEGWRTGKQLICLCPLVFQAAGGRVSHTDTSGISVGASYRCRRDGEGNMRRRIETGLMLALFGCHPDIPAES
jgi:hypothetical protein